MTHLTTAATVDPVQLNVEEIDHVPSSVGEHDHDLPISRKVQIANLLGVVIPFLALIAAMILLWGVRFNWVYMALLVGMYIFSGLGITIGYHRLFTHKSFATSSFMNGLWAVAGATAAQGSVLEWVAFHRALGYLFVVHVDLHSPHAHAHDDHDDSLAGFFKGFWHSHIGWLIKRAEHEAPDLNRYVPDLMRDPVVSSVSRNWQMWTLIGCLVPAAVGGLVTMSWAGVLLGFLWGGLVRIFLVHHITWSINSVCHIWGARPFESHDHSRNNLIFGFLAFGEGWHNNHHAFPTSARHGLRWWQFDSSWILIRAMKAVGLAWDVKVPTAERMASKFRAPVIHAKAS